MKVSLVYHWISLRSTVSDMWQTFSIYVLKGKKKEEEERYNVITESANKRLIEIRDIE